MNQKLERYVLAIIFASGVFVGFGWIISDIFWPGKIDIDFAIIGAMFMLWSIGR